MKKISKIDKPLTRVAKKKRQDTNQESRHQYRRNEMRVITIDPMYTKRIIRNSINNSIKIISAT